MVTLQSSALVIITSPFSQIFSGNATLHHLWYHWYVCMSCCKPPKVANYSNAESSTSSFKFNYQLQQPFWRSNALIIRSWSAPSSQVQLSTVRLTNTTSVPVLTTITMSQYLPPLMLVETASLWKVSTEYWLLHIQCHWSTNPVGSSTPANLNTLGYAFSTRVRLIC